MIDVRVEVRGQSVLIAALNRLGEKLRAQGLKECANEALRSMSRRVADGRDERDQPLKPIKNKRSTVLNDTGAMLASMRVQSVSANRAVIGFGGMLESKKAWWAQYGTKPHIISAKNGKALAFGSSMSTANYMRGAKGKKTRVTMANARSNARGLSIFQHVHHPGTVPRPFFGISPNDERNIQAVANAFVDRIAKETP